MSTGDPGRIDLDAQIMEGLGRVFDGIDPMPPFVDEAVILVLATANLDAELVRLVEDTRDTVRGEGQRVLRFASSSGSLLLSIAARMVGSVRIDGWLEPAQEATITVHHADGSTHRVVADAAGRFSLDDLPSGTARVLVALPGGERIATAAMRL